jgi:16S rRNA (cytidine1402-2'-O)-methyltransferase
MNGNRPGTLYLVPTPLGDTACDLVLPLAVMKQVAALDYVIAENAKSARAFLKGVHAVTPLRLALQDIEIVKLDVSTRPAELPALLEPILNGRDAGLVSEAGAPAVADPGAVLVALAHQFGVTVRPLTGPSSILLALMASGLNGQRFAFHGYLPIEAPARHKELQRLERESKAARQTQIFIETPYRNGALLDSCIASLSATTRLCVACHLSLPDENIVSLSVAEWKKHAPLDLKGKPSIFLMLAA